MNPCAISALAAAAIQTGELPLCLKNVAGSIRLAHGVSIHQNS